MAEGKEEKTVKRVCTCEKCGNESEMVVHCSLVLPEEEASEAEAAPATVTPEPEAEPSRVRGKGVCSHCGNEADMWVDL